MDSLGPVRGLGGEAGTDRAAGRGRGGEHADRGADRRDGDHGAELARPLPGPRDRGAARCAAAGSAADAGPPPDRGRDAEAAAEEARA